MRPTTDFAPRSTEATFACPCGASVPVTIYSTVNVTLQPELLYRLLAGTLNVATCPNCGRKAATSQPFIYHDMARGIFAYVHPHAKVSDEERELLLIRLRRIYDTAVAESERLTGRTAPRNPEPRIRRRTPEDAFARIQPEAPPMQVIFGVDDLMALVESLLEPEERLGRVALNTKASDAAQCEKLRTVAERLAEQAGCLVEVEDTPQEYTVWVYGPRARVNLLAAAFKQQG